MATNIFELLGTIKVDTTDFQAKIDAAIASVETLAQKINGVGGVNVGTGETGNSGTTTTTTSNTAGTGAQQAVMAGAAAAGAAGSKGGWTVGKGVLANFATQAGNWLLNEGKEFLSDGWERNVTQEKVTAQIATHLGGDMEAAKELVNELNEFAMNTPLDASGTWTTASKLLNFGIPPEELLATMQMMGDMAMGDINAMQSAAKAYSESKGKDGLYAQEAYQFINAGIPIYDILESYYASNEYSGENKGLTSGQIKGRLNAKTEDGVSVPFADMETAFMMATSPGGRYYNAMANMMDSSYGQEQRIAENNDIIGANLTNPFVRFKNETINPFILKLQKILTDRSESFSYFFNSLMDTPIEEHLDNITDGIENFWNNSIAKPLGFDTVDGIMENASTFVEDWKNLFDGLFHSDGSPIPSKSVIKEDRGGGRSFPGSDGFKTTTDLDVPLGGSAQQGFWTTMQTLVSQIKAEVTAGAQEGVAAGLSGVTITGNITTGNVTLNSGVIAGQIAPFVDIQLGLRDKFKRRGGS